MSVNKCCCRIFPLLVKKITQNVYMEFLVFTVTSYIPIVFTRPGIAFSKDCQDIYISKECGHCKIAILQYWGIGLLSPQESKRAFLLDKKPIPLSKSPLSLQIYILNPKGEVTCDERILRQIINFRNIKVFLPPCL